MRSSPDASGGDGASPMCSVDSPPKSSKTIARISRLSVSSPVPMPDVIACRNLRKYFADVKAADGLDLSVATGECFGLLGPNGAGKTTTIEILEGLTKPDSGEVEILGLT